MLHRLVIFRFIPYITILVLLSISFVSSKEHFQQDTTTIDRSAGSSLRKKNNNYYRWVQEEQEDDDTRNLSHKNKKACKPIRSSQSKKFTSIATVEDCQSHCQDNIKCLGYDYHSGTQQCTILFYWPNRKTVTNENKYCGSAALSHFGPLISPQDSSETVTIPFPDAPDDLNPSQVDCPHDQGDLLDWEDPVTWSNGILPQANEDVTLPGNSKILIRQALTQKFGIITIPSSSQLIFGAKKKDGGVSIKAHGFDVQGRLVAGSESCLMKSPVKITLVGDRPADATTNIPTATYKGISVTGTLDLHGQHFFQSWTRLARTVQPGDDYIIVQDQVNWKNGHSFVLVTTAVKDAREWHQNEVLTVDWKRSISLSSGEKGSIIFLRSPAQHTHLANNGYQGEAGLLNRWIKVMGASSDSEPTDADTLDCTGRYVWGSNAVQCPELTGFGGHIIVHNGGKGYVEGVELTRMGQTNVLGRYPIHFHDLGDECDDCYFKHSSVHRSYYRCISIHGTNNLLVTENVGYDIIGYCYYLEDGVEQFNEISFNLAAHIHYLGEAAWGNGQQTAINYESPDLALPADVTASGFYITNVNNYIIGNAASGGWAGFAFPSLQSPIGLHKDVNIRPSSLTGLTIDGNTAHSTGWWWNHGSGFYFGGALYLDSNKLVYNAGRDQDKGARSPCNVDHCAVGNCDKYCQTEDQAWVRMTNSKAFLIPSVGLNSWAGRMEIIGFEAHDVGLSLEALESGFWIDQMLTVCRTGQKWILPESSSPTYMKGDGFFWYDTGQEHIISNSTFRNCGYRSDDYDQYDMSPTRGCSDSDYNGCNSKATVFGFLTHSDQFNPESMQATKEIVYENCGRRFRLHDYRGDDKASTVSGRTQNWLDTDGTASGLNEPTMIGSGLDDAGLWWTVDNEVVDDPQGPLKFIKQNNGPNRNIGHIHIDYDDAEHNQVGVSKCGNGWGSCPAIGYIKHFGPMFADDMGLPVTANGDIAGPTGGFGWLLEMNNGAPRNIKISEIEVHPDSPLIFSVQYPPGTSVNIEANAAYCSENSFYSCKETFHAVSSPAQVRSSLGNTYHMSSGGLLTIRIIMSPQSFTGNKDWIFPDMDTVGKWSKWYAIDRFSRADITLLKKPYGPFINVMADCEASSSNNAYCKTTTSSSELPSVCSDSAFEQVAYDKCCKISDPSICETEPNPPSPTPPSPTPPSPTPPSPTPPSPPSPSPPSPTPPSPTPPTSCGSSSSGCCSQDFKTCISWCGSTESQCANCNQDVFWVCPNQDCKPRHSDCTNDKNGCCDGLTCVDVNPFYSQCRHV